MGHERHAPDALEQLAPLVYELLDAHDDTVRLLASRAPDLRSDVHLAYLRDLQRVGREALAAAAAQSG